MNSASQGFSTGQKPHVMKFGGLFFLFASKALALTINCQERTAYNFHFGSVLGTIISDGPIFFPENPFLVPKSVYKQAFSRECRGTNPLVLSQNVVFLDIPSFGRVMIDSGSRFKGPHPTSPKSGALFRNMKEAGISPESVKTVLLTHGHPDHVSGLLAPGGGPAFPNAAVYISKNEHDFWMNGFQNDTLLADRAYDFFAKRYHTAISPYNKSLHLVPENNCPLPGICFIFGPGHSPGHSAIAIVSNGDRLVVVGDNWVSKPDQLQHPEWSFFYSTNHTEAYYSRLKLLSMVASRRDLVIAYHEQFPGLGKVKQTGCAGQGYIWVPVSTSSGQTFCNETSKN